MKKIYFMLPFLATISIYSQTTIYSENFGTPTATVSLTAHTGYQNTSPVAYSGTADIRSTTASTGYIGASGNGCVFVGGSVTPAKYVIIEGINTENYSNIAMSFGHQKSTNASSNELTVEVSPDGTTWSQLNYTRATGNSSWILITPIGNIPSTTNLRIKFTNPVTSNAGFRVDDIILKGTLAGLSVQSSEKTKFNIYPTMVSKGIIYISSDKNVQKNIKIYDLSSKLILNTTAYKEVNVSTLEKGTYIITVEELGKTVSQKFIIK